MSQKEIETITTTSEVSTYKRSFLLRSLIFTSALAVTILCAFFSLVFLSQQAEDRFLENFDSISSRVLASAVQAFTRISDSNRILALTYENSYTEIKTYPNVAYPRYHEIASLLLAPAGTSIRFLPKVLSEQVNDFENFASSFFNSEPSIDPTAAEFPFGFGIAAHYPNGSFYHDLTGKTSYGSPHQMLFPILQSVARASESEFDTTSRKMFNMHSVAGVGRAIDAIITCVEGRDPSPSSRDTCESITEAVRETEDNANGDVRASLLHPVSPPNNRSALLGIVGTDLSFRRLLNEIIKLEYIDNVDCVFTAGDAVFTFTVVDGIVEYRGSDDHHDDDFSFFGRSINLLKEISTLSTGLGLVYSLTIYPREEFKNRFITEKPLYICLAVLLLMVVLLTMYFFCDLRVRQDRGEMNSVVEMKRRLVRFISHEVRTPLNTVELGLNFIKEEFKDILEKLNHGFFTKDHFESKYSEWISVVNEVLNSSNSAVLVLDDLLNYDKIETGKLRLNYEPLFVWKLIREVSVSVQKQADETAVHLRMKVEKWDSNNPIERRILLNSLRIVGDSGRFIQILKTFLSNAIQFTPSGGNVTLSAQWNPDGLSEAKLPIDKMTELLNYPRAGSVLIEVQDGGKGLTQEQIKEMNSEEAKHNETRLCTGQEMGMRLLIVKDLIKKHGGTFSVRSVGVGKGATFVVELPLFAVRDNMDEETGAALVFESVSTEALSGFKSKSFINSASIGSNSAISRPFYPAAMNDHTLIVPSTEQENEFVLQEPSMETTTAMSHHPILTPSCIEGNFNMRKDCTEVFLSPSKVDDCKSSNSVPNKLKHLLIVDDAPSNRKMLSRLVQRKGHSTEQAEDGQQAVDIYQAACLRVGHTEPFDCILMDFEMPVMNGPTATKMIRELGFKGLIVGVSGNVLPTDVRFF